MWFEIWERQNKNRLKSLNKIMEKIEVKPTKVSKAIMKEIAKNIKNVKIYVNNEKVDVLESKGE